MKEEWRVIKHFTGYMVSNRGRVKSMERIIMRRDSKPNPIKTRVLSLIHHSRGYLVVHLHKNGEHKRKLVHRLVGEAFITNPKNKPEINHKNGIKDDNRVENLEWVTRLENAHHALISGFITQGENHPNSLLTNKQIGGVRKLLKQGQFRQREIGELFSVSVQVINYINTGKTYKTV